MNGVITVPVRLDEKTFKHFVRFDLLRLRRRWVRPVVFSLILMGFAFLALFSRKAQSGLIAAVLLAVGLAEVMDAQQELSPEGLMLVIKWSQIYERMGVLVDQIIHLAETIEEAVLKNV